MQPQYESVIFKPGASPFRFFQRIEPGFAPYWHFHPELELTYIKKGQGLRFVGDHISTYREGDLVLLGGNLPHQWVNSRDPVEGEDVAFVFQFNMELLSSFPHSLPLYRLLVDSRQGLLFPSPEPSLIRMIETFDTHDPFKQVILFLEILYRLKEDHDRITLSGITVLEKPSARRHQKRVSDVTSYIMRNLNKHISLDHMARTYHMTPPSFSRWFRQSTGKRFIEFLNTLRIEKACEMLLLTDMPVIQISLNTGFESISNFNRTFKRMKNISPRDYRSERGMQLSASTRGA